MGRGDMSGPKTKLKTENQPNEIAEELEEADDEVQEHYPTEDEPELDFDDENDEGYF
jgi:hypothetical protein